MKWNASVAIVGNTNTGFEGSSWTTKEQCLKFKISSPKLFFFFFNSPKTVTWKCSALPPLTASPVPVLESKWSLCCHYLSGLQLRLLGNASHISFYCKDPFNISYILFIPDTFTFVHSVLRKVRDILAVLFWARFTTGKKNAVREGDLEINEGLHCGKKNRSQWLGEWENTWFWTSPFWFLTLAGSLSSSLLNENNSFLMVISLQLNQVTQLETSRHTVQFCHSVVCNSLRPCGLQHTRLPCPSPTPRDCLNSCPLSRWCHLTISSSVHPLLFLPSIFPSIRIFSNESVLRIRWSFSFSISPSNEYSGLISFRFDWLDLLAILGTLKSLL